MSRCPVCGDVIATGPLCTVADTDCIEFDPAQDGSEANPYAPSPIADVDADQLFSCGPNGMLVVLPDVLTNPPACQAFSSVNLSIANDTLTAVTFNSENFDTHTMHSPTVNPTRITIPADGPYVANFVFAFAPHLTGDRLGYIRVNGTELYPPVSKPTVGTWPGQTAGNTADMEAGITMEIQDEFLAGDYLEALVRQTSGGALTLVAESYSPVFTVIAA